MLWILGFLCAWCFGDQSWSSDLQCLWSCFQQDWAHPCLLYCSGCFNLLNSSVALCLVESGGNVVSNGREGCQAAFFIIICSKALQSPSRASWQWFEWLSSMHVLQALEQAICSKFGVSLYTYVNFCLNYPVLLKIKGVKSFWHTCIATAFENSSASFSSLDFFPRIVTALSFLGLCPNNYICEDLLGWVIPQAGLCP